MATKPNNLPEWATDPGADIVEPPAGKKTAGWAEAERPPAQWFNWFFHLVYRWLAFLQDYAANHTHDGGSGDLSAPQIDANNEIAWGTTGFGGLKVVKDDGARHEISHEMDGGSAQFESGTLHARQRVTAGNNIHAGDDLVADGDVIAGGLVQAKNAPIAAGRFGASYALLDGFGFAGTFTKHATGHATIDLDTSGLAVSSIVPVVTCMGRGIVASAGGTTDAVIVRIYDIVNDTDIDKEFNLVVYYVED